LPQKQVSRKLRRNVKGEYILVQQLHCGERPEKLRGASWRGERCLLSPIVWLRYQARAASHRRSPRFPVTQKPAFDPLAMAGFLFLNLGQSPQPTRLQR